MDTSLTYLDAMIANGFRGRQGTYTRQRINSQSIGVSRATRAYEAKAARKDHARFTSKTVDSKSHRDLVRNRITVCCDYSDASMRWTAVY